MSMFVRTHKDDPPTSRGVRAGRGCARVQVDAIGGNLRVDIVGKTTTLRASSTRSIGSLIAGRGTAARKLAGIHLYRGMPRCHKGSERLWGCRRQV